MENLLSEDYIQMEQELDSIAESELLKIEVDNELENAITELNNLKNQYTQKDSATLLELCKNNVIDTITSQFGLASLFINSQDGGNVTTIHNAKQKIYADKRDEYDRTVYENGRYTPGKNGHKGTWSGNSEGKKFSGDGKNSVGSEFTKSQMNKDGFLTDAYTNRAVKADTTSPDHIYSLSEFHKNGGYMLSDKEKCDFATDKNNLASIDRGINSSLRDKDKFEWANSKSNGRDITNKEFYEIDKKALSKAVGRGKETANAHLPTNKQKTLYYGKELAKSGGKDAAMMAAYSALGVVLRDLAQGIMTEVRLTFERKGQESFKEIFIRFKNRLQEILAGLKSKWKDIFKGSLEAAITAFLSNIVVFVINLFFTTLKKIVSMIRAGFVSLCQAIKLLTNPPADMPKEEVHFQVLKILTAGIIGAASLGLSAAIEKGLQAIPGLQPLMMFPIPSLGKEQRTVSDVIALTLSALAGGLLTTIVLYFMDKCRGSGKHDKLQIQLIAQSGVVIQCEISKTWCTLDDAYNLFKRKVVETAQIFIETEQELNKSFEIVKQVTASREDAMSKLRAAFNR
ncbi:MAG: hypothetical protein ACTTKL_01450 [Treponema sp.]